MCRAQSGRSVAVCVPRYLLVSLIHTLFIYSFFCESYRFPHYSRVSFTRASQALDAYRPRFYTKFSSTNCTQAIVNPHLLRHPSAFCYEMPGYFRRKILKIFRMPFGSTINYMFSMRMRATLLWSDRRQYKMRAKANWHEVQNHRIRRIWIMAKPKHK